jgi:hypothetical protein
MKTKAIILSLLCAGFLSSCAVTVPYTVTNNNIGKKTGVSSTIALGSGLGPLAVHYMPKAPGLMYQGLVLNPSFGIVDAARNGKISKIGSVDLKISNYVLWTKLEWVVTGE